MIAMHFPRTAPRVFMLSVLCLSLSACVGNRSVNYYSPAAFLYTLGTLGTLEKEAFEKPQSLPLVSAPVIRAEVISITVPAAVSRPGIVLTKSDGTMQVSSRHLWAEPLKDSLQLVLNDAFQSADQAGSGSAQLIKLKANFYSIVLLPDTSEVIADVGFERLDAFEKNDSTLASQRYASVQTLVPQQTRFIVRREISELADDEITVRSLVQALYELVASLPQELTAAAADQS